MLEESRKTNINVLFVLVNGRAVSEGRRQEIETILPSEMNSMQKALLQQCTEFGDAAAKAFDNPSDQQGREHVDGGAVRRFGNGLQCRCRIGEVADATRSPTIDAAVL